MPAPELRIIAEGPDLASVIAQLRARQHAMQLEGLSTEGERAGALWAIDAFEIAVGLRPDRFADDIHELTVGSVKGG